MKTDLTKHLVPNVELNELIADYIEKRTQEFKMRKNGEEGVMDNLKNPQPVKFQPVMLPSQLEAVQRVMRMHDVRKLVTNGFEKISCSNGDAVTVVFMSGDMHIGQHHGHKTQDIAEILSARKRNAVNVLLPIIVEKKAMVNCVDEVYSESDFIKKTCNTKVKVKFEGQHPVPFYHKGRW